MILKDIFHLISHFANLINFASRYPVDGWDSPDKLAS